MSARVYRDDLSCPHCGSHGLPQYGTARGRQSDLCRGCHSKFTPGGHRSHYAESTQCQAFKMYCAGLHRSAIARVREVKKLTV